MHPSHGSAETGAAPGRVIPLRREDPACLAAAAAAGSEEPSRADYWARVQRLREERAVLRDQRAVR